MLPYPVAHFTVSGSSRDSAYLCWKRTPTDPMKSPNVPKIPVIRPWLEGSIWYQLPPRPPNQIEDFMFVWKRIASIQAPARTSILVKYSPFSTAKTCTEHLSSTLPWTGLSTARNRRSQNEKFCRSVLFKGERIDFFGKLLLYLPVNISSSNFFSSVG